MSGSPGGFGGVVSAVVSGVVRGRFCSRRVLIASLGGPPCRPAPTLQPTRLSIPPTRSSRTCPGATPSTRDARPRAPWPSRSSRAWNGPGSGREWQQVEPRLAGFASLEEAREGWRRRDERCYQVVAGLTALGSRRGGDDDDAALAVAVLLEDGVNRVAMTLNDVCEIDDVNATVWEEVKAAEPQLGCHAAALPAAAGPAASEPPGRRHGLPDRARPHWRRGSRRTTPPPLSVLSDGVGREDRDRDLLIAVPEVEDPVEDLADLLTWAREVGVICARGCRPARRAPRRGERRHGREEAQRVVGERHGVAMRTIRRRRDRTAARLRDAAPTYLAAIA